MTGTGSPESTSVNPADFFEEVMLEWNLIRGVGDSLEGKKKKHGEGAEVRGSQVFSGGGNQFYISV